MKRVALLVTYYAMVVILLFTFPRYVSAICNTSDGFLPLLKEGEMICDDTRPGQPPYRYYNKCVGTTLVPGDCGDNAICEHPTDARNNKLPAHCISNPLTPTPTYTPTPSPTPIPTIDPAGKCTHSERKGEEFIAGSQICVEKSLTRPWEVQECRKNSTTGVWEFVQIGTCGTFPGLCTSKNPPNLGDSCNATFTPLPTPDPIREAACNLTAPPGQQLIPKPGTNCGIAAESPLPAGADESARYCCSSSLVNKQFVNLACFITLPGAESFLADISDILNKYIDCAPNFFSCNTENQNLMSIGAFRDALKDIDPCAPGTIWNDKTPGTTACGCNLPPPTSLAALCNRIVDDPATSADDTEKKACTDCMLKSDGSGGYLKDDKGNYIPGEGIWTGIGCINVSTEAGFVEGVLGLGVSLGGAFAILCNIYGAFLFQTAGGSPDNVNKARTLITSCITGLLLIIFSVFILNLIGFQILRIPGLGN